MALNEEQLRQPVTAVSAWWKRRHGDNSKDKPSWVDPAPLGDCDRTQTRKLVWVKTRAQPARRLEDGAWSPDAGDHDATWTVRAELVKCAGRPTLGQDGSSEKWGGGNMPWGGDLHEGGHPDPVQRFAGSDQPRGVAGRIHRRPAKNCFTTILWRRIDRSRTVIPVPPPGRRARRGVSGDQ